MSGQDLAVVLVYSTSHAIRAEKLLNQQAISCKLIPVPRHLSSDCGVCVRIDRTDVEDVRRVLEAGRVEIDAVHTI
jgi:hypothetical protein